MFTVRLAQGQLRLLGSPDGRDGSITIHQDVQFYAAHLQAGETIRYRLAPNRVAWLQVARGSLDTNGHTLLAGDGVAVIQEAVLTLQNPKPNTEVLLFDMAA
jgi:quercetin 2,3-dioxygenase